MDWLRRFMIGRYGPDQLGVALLIVYLILIFFAPLTGLWIFRLLALAVLILCLFRMLSRNTARRYQENLKFLAFWNPIKSWFQKKKAVQGFQDPSVLQMPQLQKYTARSAWKRENSDYLPGLPYRIY
ncbi:MAG: hypothetical protein ACLS8R_03295 [Anaeromassilibacillus sp.]